MLPKDNMFHGVLKFDTGCHDTCSETCYPDVDRVSSAYDLVCDSCCH